MPQGVTKIETGRLMTDRGQPILLRDDGGCWGLFFERNPNALMGQRVTVRGIRYGFGRIHVTGVVQGSEAPPEDRRGRFGDIMCAGLFALASAALIVSVANTLWSFAISIVN